MVDLYNQENTNFNNNGDITLNPSSAIVTVELNGIYHLNIIHPYDELGRWSYLKNGAVVKVSTPTGEQLFRIYDTKKGMLGFEAQARHIFFDLVKKNLFTNTHIKSKDGQEALDIILSSTPYIGHSDIVTINDCYFFKENIVSAINGENENTFIKRWGGEILLDNFNVHINSRIGGDYGVKISYGNNMEDIEFHVDTEGIITRLYPYVLRETTDTIELPEEFIDSENIDKYPQIYEQYIDLSEYMHLKENDEDVENAYETEEELYEAMRNKCRELFAGGLDKPNISGTVNMIVLENTEEYKDVKGLVKVGLGDDVSIFYKDIDIETKTRCVGFEWDVLKNKYISISIGELRKDFFDLQNDTTNKLNNVLNNNGTINPSKMQGTINALKTHFSAMRDIAQPQEVRAMLFEDRIKGSATYGATAIGTMGLMIASERTPDDREWNWRTFIGGGYAYADWLIGKLKTVLIENMDGSFSMDLNKPGGMIFRNNGIEALRIQNNAMDMFNWGKAGEYIGSLISLARNNDINKPVVALINHTNSAVMVGYKDKNNLNNWFSYVDFDKFNLLGSGSPIRVHEDIALLNSDLFLGPNNETQIYNSDNNYLCAGVKNGFNVFHKVTDNNIFHLEGVKAGFLDWQSGKYYAFFSGDNFTLPGIFKNKGDSEVVAERDFRVNGRFTCVGQKNRVVKTEHYGERLQNAMESPECWFIDYGEGKLINGKAVITIDPIHLETINTDYPYKVRVWSDDGTKVWSRKVKRYEQYFIVEGEADCDFEYEIIAKQKDYENVRLEEAIRDEEYYLNKRKNKGKGGMRSGAFKESHIRNKQRS
ncbi:phage tail spike protein [Clostridium baratii]|uniref:phage tail spike protein n=1 Tax=Clostridium baratii TaxID=1561 RepID=UPI0030CF97D6